MSQFTWKFAALSALSSAGMAMLMQACGGGGNAYAQSASGADPIEGVWSSAVTIQDCQSGAPLATFTGTTGLVRGGGATAVNSQPQAGQGPGLGVWSKQADGTYLVQFRFFRFGTTGVTTGTQRVTRTLTLGSDATTMTGMIAAQVLDPAGTVLQSICGAETATRVF